MESAELEGIIHSSSWPQQSHPVPDQSSVQTIPELYQVWCCYPCPGKPVPVPNHPLGEETFPDTQTKPENPDPASGFRSCHWSAE